MIHTFKCLDLNLLLDVESGSVFVVDEITCKAAELYEGRTPEQVADLLPQYSKGEVIDVCAELEELKNQGALYSSTDTVQLSQVTARNKSVVKSLCLNIAHDCNLRCEYCFASTGEYKGGRCLMPLEVACKAIDFLMQHSGSRHQLEVDFFGGEPLMNFDVVKKTVEYGRMQEKKYGKIIRFTMTTNCVLINDEVREFLDKEMYNVVLSVDGRREVHDRMRKTVNHKPSFDILAPNALAVAKDRKDKQYYVRGTFTGYNLDFYKDAEFLSDYGFDQISIEPAVVDENAPYALKEEQLPQIYESYEKLARLYLKRRGTDKSFEFFHFNIDLTGGPCLPKRVTGCGAGNEYVAIAPTGDIYPCHQFVGMDEQKMGSVLTGEFNAEKQAEFKACNVMSKKDCLQCWAKYYCSGGCLANAYIYNGDIYRPYKMACMTEKKHLEYAIALNALKNMENQDDN